MEQIKNIEAQYELLKIILEFVGTIIWPVVAFVVILIYRKAILNLINRTRKVELPGGVSLETVEEEIKQAKELAQEMKVERKPDVQKIIDKGFDSQTNKRMIELGLTPSPSGLNLSYYKEIANTDPRLALIGLKTDFELMLRNLAKGFKIPTEENESIARVIPKLLKGGAITTRQYEFINTVFRISNTAVQGVLITKEQVYEVLDIGQVLIDDYVAWLEWGFRR